MDFRKEKFNLLDEQHRLRGIASTTDVPGGAPAEGNKPIIEGSLSIIKKKIFSLCVRVFLLAEYKLDTDVKPTLLKFQKRLLLQSDKDFELQSLGCYICQENFETIEKYEEHVEYHGDESDFQSLKKMKK